jgi:hypothetical protein
VALDGMPQTDSRVNRVPIPAPLAPPHDHTGLLELRDDPLHRALGDPDLFGHTAQGLFRIAGQTEENVAVVAEKSPTGRCRRRRFRHGALRH